MSTPLISVIMPVYNGEEYLREAIESILNQTYINYEFIILNDGSTDKTEEIILSYVDSRILYIKNETNLQIVKTLNKGIALAKGKYIARMDADDISLPKRFERQVAFMEEHPGIDVCGTWFKTFGKKKYIQKLPICHNEIKACLLFYTPIAHPTVMMKKTIFDNNQYSDVFSKAEDYALWLHLIDDFKFENLSEVLLDYRLHSSQTCSKSAYSQKNSTIKALSVLLKKFDRTFFEKYISLHIQHSRNEYIELEKIEKWLQDLIAVNIEVQYFDDQSLKNCVFEIWKSKAFVQPQNNLSIWMLFYQSTLYISKKTTFRKHLIFAIKCIIHYSSK